MIDWLDSHLVEIFGAITGIIYVFLEIKQKIWLWPLGIITSAVYICVFFASKFYADMGLQAYYLLISVYGWYWWHKKGRELKGKQLRISRIRVNHGLILLAIFIFIFAGLWYILINYTDSPVPGWDSFTTALSIIATWMLARKIIEHWILQRTLSHSYPFWCLYHNGIYRLS